MKISSIAIYRVKGSRNILATLKVVYPIIFKLAALLLLILGLARPQTFTTQEEVPLSGIDIVIVLDLSPSMKMDDISPSRFLAAKSIIKDFIQKRVNDKIALVVFAHSSYLLTPLTFDYNILSQFLDRTYVGFVGDGTAIGVALLSGVNLLKELDSKSKIIILLTDGANNAGNIAPLTAAKIAKKFGIKIYSIALGKPAEKTKLALESGFDAKLLSSIAKTTDGEFYTAINLEELRDVYDKIDQLEKHELKVKVYTKHEEYFHYFLYGALILLIAVLILPYTILRVFP